LDISKTISQLKQRPDFTENVGMILTHNGTVRAWSRNDREPVSSLEVQVDQDTVEKLRQEYLSHEGIYEIIIEAHSGTFFPGDDLLFLVVAGDLRENIKPVLSDLLDRIKSEAVIKKERAV
jgi:molybdopterin synthase catalytic subunit